MTKLNLTNIKNNVSNALQIQNFHFFVICACFLLQMFNWGQFYRLFAYLNFGIVLMYGYKQLQLDSGFNNKALIYITIIPLGFVLIHLVATSNLMLIKEMRHIFLAAFLALGIWILAKENHNFIKQNIFGFALTIILIYVVVQAIALWGFNKPYGTTKNPHYLAIYSAVSLIVATYCFFKASVKLKYLLGISIILLGAFLLHTSSRPTWIGLIVSSFLLLIFLNKITRIYAALAILAILIALSITNIANFAGRFEELLIHLHTEERVVIWQDTWKMLSESSPANWLVGHGLDSFKEDFKQFSHYHLQNIDFNSPHNFVLELLYISGIAGFTLSIFMFFIIYKNLFAGMKAHTQFKSIYLVLLSILTSNLILVGITLPFFTSYNLNIIALVTGIILYFKEITVKKFS